MTGTPEVHLRPLQPGDEEASLAWTRDREFCLANEWPLDVTPEQHRAHWRACITAPPQGLARLAVEHAGRLVGYVDLLGSDPYEREIGYAIGDSDSWGKGLGSAATAAMVAYGFEELGLHRITAEVFASNTRSLRVVQRLGFVETHRGDTVEYRGEQTPTVWLTLTRDSWLADPR